jgi:hypothetical protein
VSASVRSTLGMSSSKLGSGEFMRLRLGDGLSFFLMMFLCQSFRQFFEAEICWFTARCVVKAFWQNWQRFNNSGGMVRCSRVTGKPLRRFLIWLLLIWDKFRYPNLD